MKPVTGMIIGALFALGWQTDLPRGIADHFATFQESALESAAQYVTPANQLPTSEPVTTPDPEPVVQKPDVQEQVATPDPPPARVTPIEIDSQPAAAAPTAEVQLAWKPFRNEASAAGFARRLSDQLGHEFYVIREGPGRYQVGFNYISSLDRDAVLTSIETMTGFRPAP